MEGSTKRVHESDAGHASSAAQSHVWIGRWFWFPWLSSIGAATNGRPNGQKPSNVGPVLFERSPFTAFKYSGGGTTIVQLAITDTLAKPFAEIMRERVLDPLGMTDSTYEQPLPSGREAKAARAQSGQGKSMDAKSHVYPEQAAAGLWTTPTDLARFSGWQI